MNIYESNVEKFIANNYHLAQKYFPRLSHYLLNLTSGDIPRRFCECTNYINAKLFLYLLCSAPELNLHYINAFDKFKSLVTYETRPNSYLKFKDGYVYSKSFNEVELGLLIEDSAIDVCLLSEQIIDSSDLQI